MKESETANGVTRQVVPDPHAQIFGTLHVIRPDRQVPLDLCRPGEPRAVHQAGRLGRVRKSIQVMDAARRAVSVLGAVL